jgi:predicted ATPase
MAETDLIRTPDQRVRVFVSSTLGELAAERRTVRDAIAGLRLVPVMFDLGARPHPPRSVYRDYPSQSQIFVGIYWQSYGWVAPGERVSGLEDEYLPAAGPPRLIYVKSPAPDREPRLAEMLSRIRDEGDVSYQHFSDPAELQSLVQNDLAVLLSERFEMAQAGDGQAQEAAAPALPADITSLVGREQDAEAAGDLVLREGVRLVTLTGPGGVGKSRLALEVARRLGPRFAGGVRFVDLAPVQRADLVVAAIAAGLGLRISGGPLIADVKAYLRPRRLVLLLDNFEQVTPAAPLVAELLAAAAGLVVLVTSRTMLGLSGEHEFPVAPLPTPQLVGLQRYASVQLFVERAHAAAPGFELTSENAGAIAEICRRLDGLPLAIELAAARSRLPPQALLARLDDRMSLLTGGARDLPERQRTLRNTLDWSFGLLSPAAQALFLRLGVFPGGFDLEAGEAVGSAHESGPAGQDQAGEIIDTLASLVDASLVREVDRAGQPRFSLLGTGLLREGLSVASDAGDESCVGYYLQRLAALAAQREDPDRAVRLLAAADTVLQAAGTGWLLAYVARAPSEADALPELRSRLGEAAFQQAWAQGAAMGRQHAVEYAQQD